MTEPRCSICRHEDRAKIESRLMTRDFRKRNQNTFADVAREYGFHENTIRRHYNKHMGESLIRFDNDKVVKDAVKTARTKLVKEVSEAQHFIDDFDMIRRKAFELLAEAEADAVSGDKRLMHDAFYKRLRVLQELRAQTDLRAKVVLQLLDMGKDDGINRQKLENFLTELREALEEYPEALAAVTFAMRKVEP